MIGRLVSRLKANAGRLVSIVLVVGVFVFVLPRVGGWISAARCCGLL